MEIVLGAGVLLTHHVQMALQNHAFAVYHARRCRLANDEIARRIQLCLKRTRLRPLLQGIAQGLLVLGRTRNGTQGLEVFPHRIIGRQRKGHGSATSLARRKKTGKRRDIEDNPRWGADPNKPGSSRATTRMSQSRRTPKRRRAMQAHQH